MKQTWIRTKLNRWELEGTNYRIDKVIENSISVYKVYNFSTCIGMACKMPEAKKIVKMNRGE